MTEVFSPAPVFGCICCNSTRIGSSKKERRAKVALCDACSEEFTRWSRIKGDTDNPDNDLNRWLARRLTMDAKRMHVRGVTGRCEAIAMGPRGWIDGHVRQCRGRAVAMVEGHRVCGGHARASNPAFINTFENDAYADLQRVVTHLVKVDERFRACVAAALSA